MPLGRIKLEDGKYTVRGYWGGGGGGRVEGVGSPPKAILLEIASGLKFGTREPIDVKRKEKIK